MSCPLSGFFTHFFCRWHSVTTDLTIPFLFLGSSHDLTFSTHDFTFDLTISCLLHRFLCVLHINTKWDCSWQNARASRSWWMNRRWHIARGRKSITRKKRVETSWHQIVKMKMLLITMSTSGLLDATVMHSKKKTQVPWCIHVQKRNLMAFWSHACLLVWWNVWLTVATTTTTIRPAVVTTAPINNKRRLTKQQVIFVSC